MTAKTKLVPIIVASPVFLQNIDTTAMVIALPSIAATLHVPLLQLNLVITAYLVSLAVFLPLSAWLADRYGARNIFCVAVSLFSLSSALCGLADSLPVLVLCRVVQGLGGAMMVPVGRLILLRSIPQSEMIAAIVWYTIPPQLGRLSGPLIGGAIVSFTSWHWIFFVNIPFGAVAVALALLYVDDDQEQAAVAPFDYTGFALMASGLAALLGALQLVGKGLVAPWVAITAALAGVAALGLYVVRSRRMAEPIIDLAILRFRTFRVNIIGAMPLRLSLSAIPFLLPLLMQLGFGLSPLATGLIAAASALGALCTRAVVRGALARFGFRWLLLGATSLSALFYISFALFTAATPHVLMFIMIFGSGLLSSMCMVLLNTLGFVEVPKERTSHATALTAMAQQLMAGLGVLMASLLLDCFSRTRGGDGVHLEAGDFAAAFVTTALVSLLSIAAFRTLRHDEGEAFR